MDEASSSSFSLVLPPLPPPLKKEKKKDHSWTFSHLFPFSPDTENLHYVTDYSCSLRKNQNTKQLISCNNVREKEERINLEKHLVSKLIQYSPDTLREQPLTQFDAFPSQKVATEVQLIFYTKIAVITSLGYCTISTFAASKLQYLLHAVNVKKIL